MLVVNIGNPSDPRPPEIIEAARAGIEAHLSVGGAILGVHSSATSLTTMPQWPASVCRAQTSGFYDGLGHDSASYGSQGHVELIRRAVRWLLRAL